VELVNSDDARYLDCQVFLQEQGVDLESNDQTEQYGQFVKYLRDHPNFALIIESAKLHFSQRKTLVQGYTDLEKQVLVQELVNDPAFIFADVQAILVKFNIENLPRFYERQIQLLT